MINREATIRWKGYDPDNLKPQSNKRVWANCDKCGKGRWVIKGDYADLCDACSRSIRQNLPKPKFVPEEDKFIPGTGVDRIITIQKMGYDPADLKQHSDKIVWANCRICGKGRWITYSDRHNLCKLCSQTGDDIIQHHYTCEDSDKSKNTVGITRSDHMSLHRLLQKLAYIVPHINVKEK